MLSIAVVILILHTPGGHEVGISAEKIVSMRDGEGRGEYVTKKVGCVINTNDGKFIGVIESCAEVRRMIEERR